jgi:uncharacterized protein (UPF0548 family)
MNDWRFVRTWSDEQIKDRLCALRKLERNFSGPADQMTLDRGWNRYSSEATIAQSTPGLPTEDGLFERGRTAVANYEFSDPRILIAHFDPDVPLAERYLLLEMRALRVFRFLGGVVVGAVRSEQNDSRTMFGFRYDTLEGHIERGAEWFTLTKEHETGVIRFRIEASWRPGQFPNWWSRLGFSLLGPHYQKKWHERAHRLLAQIIHTSAATSVERTTEEIAHSNPDVIFERTSARNV